MTDKVIKDVAMFPSPFSQKDAAPSNMLTIKYLSGASQLLSFRDDAEYDASERLAITGYDNLGAKLWREPTRRERVIMTFETCTGVFVGLQPLAWAVAAVIGVVGAISGVWSFSRLMDVFAVVAMIDLMLVASLGIFALADLLPKYPDLIVPLPEEELRLDQKIVEAWKHNDLGTALSLATTHQA